MKFILIAILLFSIISCSKEAKKQHRQNEITKVSYGYGSWSGSEFQIEIDNSLTYKLFREPNQYFIGKISQELWDSLNIRFERLNYRELDSLLSDVIDGRESGLVVYRNGLRHSGHSSFEAFPKEMQEAISWLLTTQQRVTFKETVDRLPLEFPIVSLPPPPPPDYNGK